jgi:PAS domain S-box-containing protein
LNHLEEFVVNHINSKAHDFFFQMLSLSISNKKEKVIEHFINSTQEFLPEVKIRYSEEAIEDAMCFPIASQEYSYGCIVLENAKKISTENQSLLNYSISLLAAILKQHEQESSRIDNKIHLQDRGTKKPIDFHLPQSIWRETSEIDQQNSQTHLSTIIDNISDFQVLVKYTERGIFRIVTMNKAYLNAVSRYCKNVTEKDLLGKTLQDVFVTVFEQSTAVIQATLSNYQKAIDTGNSIAYEESAVISDQPYHSKATLSPIFDTDNSVQYILYTSHDVTLERETQKQLEENEKNYKAVLENAKEGILIAQDRERKYYNSSWLEITGYTAEEYETVPFLSLIHPDDRELLFKAHDSTIAGKPFENTLKFRMITKSGKTAYIDAKPTRTDWEGRPAGMLFLLDASKKVEMEANLREKERSLYTLMSNVPGMSYRCLSNKKWTMIFISEGCYALTGYNPNDLMQNNKVAYGDLILAEDQDRVWKFVQHSIQTKEPFQLTYRIKTKSGEQKWVWEKGCGVYSKEGELQTLEGFISDITEIKQAETNLQRNESLLNAVQRLAKVGGWEWDVRTDTMYWTDEAYRIHGYDPNDIEPGSSTHIQRSIDCYDKADQPTVLAAFEQCAKEGTGYDQEYPFTTVQGERKWIRTTAKAIKENGKIIKVIGNIVDITERKKTETALKINEARYEKAQALGHVGNWEYDLQTTHFWASEETKRIYGYSPDQDDFTTEEVENCIPERQSVHQALLDLIEKGQDYNLEFDIITKDKGERKTITSVAELERDADGTPIKVMGVIADITERMLIEKKLLDEANKWQTTVNAMSNSVSLVDINGNILQYNSATLKMLKVSDKQIKHKKCWELVHGLSEPIKNCPTFRMIKSKQPESAIFQKNDPWLEVSVDPILNAEDQLIGAVHVINDITERTQAEEALRTSEEQLRLIIENTSDSVALTTFDLKATYKYVNPSIRALLGYKVDDLIGKSFFSFIHPDDKKVLFQLLKSYTKQKYENLIKQQNLPLQESIEYRFRTKAGEWRYLQSTINVAGRQLLSISRDITEQKQAEADLREKTNFIDKIINSSAVSTWISDEKGTLIRANAACLDFFGATEKEVLGKYNLFQDSVLENSGFMPDVKRAFEKGHIVSFVVDYDFGKVDNVKVKNPTHKIIHTVLTPVLDDAGNVSNVIVQSIDLTEINQTKKYLQESKDRFDLAMNATQDGLYDWDLATNKIYFSPGWKRMLGYKDHELPNDFSNWEKLTHPKDVKRSLKMKNDLIMKKKDRFELEFKMKHKDGHWIDIYARANAQFNNEGKAIRIIGTHVDISQRKQSENMLRQNEEKFRALFEQVGHYCMILDPNTTDGIPKILDANNAAASVHGYTREEFIGRPVSDIDDEEGKGLVKERTALIMTGKPFYVENTHVCKDGSTFPVAVNAQRIDIGDGPPLIFTTEYDISDRKKVERENRSYISFLDTIMDKSPFAMWISDSKGTVIRTNRILRDKLNLTDEKIIGHYNILYDANIIEQGKMPEVKAVFEEKKTTRFDIPWFAAKAGDDSFNEARNLWIDISIFPIVDESGDLINIVCQWVDITGRKKAEEELEQHHEHLEELVKARTVELQTANKELEAFAYSVSHDLRAPLRAIDGFTNMLMQKYGATLDVEGNRIGSIIQDNAQKMSQLISDLLAFSRTGRKEIKFSTIDMKNMANAIYFEASDEEERKRVTFTLSELPQAQGDPNMMRQVWMNLISNALKFSAQREQITLSVTYQAEKENTIYCVKDNGAGFNMKYADKLFNVFQRLHSDEEFKGTGVGLAVVQRIIHRHGGRVWAEAEEENGAAFYFSVPIK